MNFRVVMNITTSADWRRRPVGIVRVERELTKAIFKRFGARIVPVYLDRARNNWKTIDSGCFMNILSDNWVHSDDPDNDAAQVKSHLLPFSAHESDRFVTVGSDWSFDVPAAVEKVYGSQRVMISALYDLIPLLFPEFTPGNEFYDQFNVHYSQVARLARSVFSISETSADSLREFWREKSLLEIAPPIEVVPLAGPAHSPDSPALSDGDKTRLADIERNGPFILYVSTIEPRKNHQILIDIWRQLYFERGPKCPKLILVGMKGWGSSDFLAMTTRMNAFTAGKIAFHEGVSDRLLSELYRRSLFTVFPSYFEGWGLAATEAASFGKVCVISNTSALAEATKCIMPSYHPLDFPGWKAEIEHLLDDDSYRSALERRVVAADFARNWNDFGDDFCEKLLGE